MGEMTIDTFMLGIKENVRNAAVDDSITRLKEPTGRKPRIKHVHQSEWFNALSDADKAMVAEVLKESVDEALFGLFAVLDGVRDIADIEDIEDIENIEDIDFGHYELIYARNGTRVLLNEPNAMDLHDEYNALTNTQD